MRPITLSMTAFGPYASREFLDFRELGDKRFFLIHGPTGAGKTSILDALTFALYGATSGEERSGDDMRSQFAAPDVLTEVTLEFSVGAERYRVWRRPGQDRPKLRGEGFTHVAPDAALWCRTACGDDGQEGTVVATGVRDVGAAVQDLLGFSEAQFRQVVVLPQGRFREVLSADVRQREEILKQLFRTERFASITEFMKARRGELDRQIKGSLERRQGVLESAKVESREELDALECDAAQRAAQQAIARDAAQSAAQAAQSALEAGRTAASTLAEQTAANVALGQLEASEPAIAEKRVELDAARAAQTVEGPWQMRESRRSDELRAREALERAQAAVPAARAAFEAVCELTGQAEAAERDEAAVRELEQAAATASRTASDLERLAKAASAVRDEVDRAREAQGRAEAARAEAENARAHAAQTELSWRSGRAAALAATLTEGEECPVCGSEHHPHPATGGVAVDDAELDAVRTQAARAESAHASALATADAAQKAAEQAQARLEDEKVALGDVAAGDPLAARAEAQRLLHEADTRRAALKKAEADLASCRSRRDATQVALAQADAAATAAQSAIEAAAVERGRAEAAFEAALRAADFADESAFLVRRRVPSELDALEAAVVRFGEEIATARGRAQRAREAAAQVLAPDIAALEVAQRDADTALEAATQAFVGADKDRQRYREAIEAIVAIETQSAELHARHAVIARLADVAEGSNPLRLSFQRFVLGTYLDDVLVHASYRLQRMTGGRYRLQRATAVTHRGRAAGLDLAVYDEQTDRTRPAGTLSGGEGFLASLALALGLAEAVQAHAGGVKLETIFVDEGFGTLDPESLDLAVNTLLDLAGVQAGAGRLVGIISHVPELQQQIDARLEVSRTERGSTARFVV